MVIREFPTVVHWVKNPTAMAPAAAEAWVFFLCSPVQWVKGCGLAIAMAVVQSLAQERPYATDVAIKKLVTRKITIFGLVQYDKYVE